jgi:hypothetical protein
VTKTPRKKLDKCNLAEDELDRVFGWRPLRDFIAAAVGSRKPVQVCKVGMVAGAYQVTIGKITNEFTQKAEKMAAKIYGMKRVYTKDPALVYQVMVPDAEPKELTWAPQKVNLSPLRPAPYVQGALFQGKRINVRLLAPETVKISGRCQGTPDNCRFALKREGEAASASGIKELPGAVNRLSVAGGSRKAPDFTRCKIVSSDADGDKTLRCGNKLFILSKDGKAFEQVDLNDAYAWGLDAPVKLLTKEILGKLPPLYSQEHVKDPMVWAKFFTPDANYTWYAIEFDGDDLFFGLVIGQEPEIGYFSLKELQKLRGRYGLPVERDKWFRPAPLSAVKKAEKLQLADWKDNALRVGKLIVGALEAEDVAPDVKEALASPVEVKIR